VAALTLANGEWIGEECLIYEEVNRLGGETDHKDETKKHCRYLFDIEASSRIFVMKIFISDLRRNFTRDYIKQLKQIAMCKHDFLFVKQEKILEHF
jgi:hypothetical protein